MVRSFMDRRDDAQCALTNGFDRIRRMNGFDGSSLLLVAIPIALHCSQSSLVRVHGRSIKFELNQLYHVNNTQDLRRAV